MTQSSKSKMFYLLKRDGLDTSTEATPIIQYCTEDDRSAQTMTTACQRHEWLTVQVE